MLYFLQNYKLLSSLDSYFKLEYNYYVQITIIYSFIIYGFINKVILLYNLNKQYQFAF